MIAAGVDRRSVARAALVPVLTVLLCGGLLEGTAAAQASVAGTVRDASGAVLPGVIVEAFTANPTVPMRTVVTDGSGQFTIADLRPGRYSIVCRLAGFDAVTRDGIDLTGSFTATVNVTLSPSGVQESVHVQPVSAVDVRSPAFERTMTAALVAAVPTGRSLANLGVLIPGMTTVSARNQFDVGGTNNLQNIFMAIHGGRVTDERIYVDGVDLRNLQSEGHATNFTPDMSSTEEVSIGYGLASAEHAYGGINANYVPRTGGDAFHGTAFLTGATGAFQGDNLTMTLRAEGLMGSERLKRTYDINPTLGGPIRPGHLWFYAAARAQTNQNYIGAMFENRNAGNPDAWTYDPDVTKPAVFAITQRSAGGRVTWKADARNTLSVYAEKQWRTWDEGNVNRAPEAFSRFRFRRNQVAAAGWSSTPTNRLLVEVRAAFHAETWQNIGGDDLLANNRSLIPVLEQGGSTPGLMYRAKNATYTGASAPFIKIAQASVAYVTGAHVFKTGANWVSGTNTMPVSFNDSGLQYRFNNAVPNQITEFATPYDMVWQVVEAGAYAQDRWTVRRLTVDAGLRLDLFRTSFPAEHLGPGPLTPGRDITLPAASWYRFADLSPRLGATIDLFGDGRTALRVGAGRYVVALSPATGNPVSLLPLAVTRTWTDANRDYVPDCNVLDPTANGECGLVSDLNFGTERSSTTYDPAILRGWNVRPMNWEFTTGIQHELFRRTTVSAAFVRRIYGNFTVQDNLETDASDYTPFSVLAPLDARLPRGGGYPVGGLFDLNPDKQGLVRNYVTFAGRYGHEMEHWNGVDVTVQARRSVFLLQGGMSTGRTSTDVCGIAANLPEILGTATGFVGSRQIDVSLDRCHVETAWLTQVKGLGTVMLPRLGMQLAAAWQSAPGPELQANYVASSAAVQPSLGRPLSGAANTTVTLLPPGSEYGDRLNQLDLRIGKALRRGRFTTAVNLDVYNALNANPVTAANLTYSGDGSRWLQPQAILAPRLFKFSVQMDY